MDLPAVPFSTQSCAASTVYYHFSQGRLAVPPPPSPATDGGDGGAADARSEAFLGLPEMERSEFPSSVFDHGPYLRIAKQALKQFAHEGKDDWVLFNSFDDLEGQVSINHEVDDFVWSVQFFEMD
jgi:UDP-glucose:(indol-3-yl)acetate beta-D-glucosyltransferase